MAASRVPSGSGMKTRSAVPVAPAVSHRGPARRSRATSSNGSPSERCAVDARRSWSRRTGVEHGLLGRLDRGGEERVEVAAGDRRAGRRAAAQRAQTGRQRQEDLAARVVAGAAGAGQPEAGPAGEPLAAGGVQRPVGDDDDDARPGRAGDRAPRRGGSCAPTGTPATVSRSASPKFASTRTPTVWPDGHDPRRGADAALPAEAASCPCRRRPRPRRAAGTVPTEARAADSASRTSSWVTCIRRASLRNESSHSATSGMITSSTPIAGSSSASSSQAAS